MYGVWILIYNHITNLKRLENEKSVFNFRLCIYGTDRFSTTC